MTNIFVFNAALIAACAYALAAGGAPERATASVFLAAAAATYVAPFNHYKSVATVVLVVDVMVLAAMTLIALRANRFWPIYESALLLLTVSVHGVKAYQPTFAYWMYHGTIGKLAYPTLILLVIGVFRHRARVARFGFDRPWSSSGRSPDHSPAGSARSSPLC